MGFLDKEREPVGCWSFVAIKRSGYQRPYRAKNDDVLLRVPIIQYFSKIMLRNIQDMCSFYLDITSEKT